MSIKLSINNKDYEVDASPETPLLWVLRDHVKLKGTKFGCGMSMCGACTVLKEGEAIRSCVTPVSTVAGANITTIEGNMSETAEAVQVAWEEQSVAQCGYCQPGQIMSATALLSTNPKPSDDEIDAAMSGNICRCATYVRIRKAIKQASSALSTEKNNG